MSLIEREETKISPKIRLNRIFRMKCVVEAERERQTDRETERVTSNNRTRVSNISILFAELSEHMESHRKCDLITEYKYETF